MSQAIGLDPAGARPLDQLLAFLGRQRWVLVLGLAAGTVLYLAAQFSYLLFHTLTEMFCVVVASTTFVIAWNARRYTQNGYLLWVGIVYLALGFLDLLHTLTYTGMTIIPGYPFAANQLWIAARFLECLALLVGFAYLRFDRRPDPALSLLGFATVTGLIIAAIFVWEIFPACYVAGLGQTRFKILSEYVIMAILGVDALLLVVLRDHFHRDIHRPLLGALALAILTEAAFTRYVSNYGAANFLGHLFKVCSYSLFYVAIVKHGVERPYDMVFRELDETNRRLTAETEARRRSEERLEIRVVERTAALDHANRLLRVISACNETLARATLESGLVREICQRVAHLGGYQMACLRYLEAGQTGPALCAQWGVPCLGAQTCAEPGPGLWLQQAAATGHQASIGFPMQLGEGLGATLEIFTPEAENLNEVETDMLRKLANDLSFGIAAIRSREERDRVRLELEERTRTLRTLTGELVQSEHRERRRLAKVLHDNLQQILVAAKWRAGALVDHSRSVALRTACRQLEELLDEAIQSSRSLATELSPGVLQEKGLAEALIWLAERMWERHALKVEVSAAPEQDTLPVQLKEFLFDAIRELLFNVIKHAGVDRARVRLQYGPGRLQVTVEDDGAGFDVEAAKNARNGSGLGLFSVQERLTHLGGWLEMASAPGRGSTFRLTVPLEEARTPLPEAPVPACGPVAPPVLPVPPPALPVPPPALPVPPPALPVPAPQAAPLRVMLVDDHQVVRQGLSRLLEGQEGIAMVGEASDGLEAVALTRTLRPDVVLMDINMPGLNGIEATRMLRAEHPQLRIIGLSMHQEVEIAQAMVAAGAQACVAKSDPVAHILKAILSCQGS